MATLYYFVRTSATKKTINANIRVRLGIGKKYYYGITPLTVDVKLWNTTKQRVDSPLFKDTGTEINKKLLEIELTITNSLNQLVNTKNIDSKWFQNQIDNYFEPKIIEEQKESTFIDYVNDFVLKAPNMVIKKSGKKLDPKTITKYELTQKYIIEFTKKYNSKLPLYAVDYSFYEGFYEFLTNNKKFATNNVGKHIDTLKVFLNAARRNGYKVNTDIEYFTEPSEDSENTYYREDELDKLMNKDLSRIPHLERVRDLFIVGCWTGLRYSDLTSLERDDLNQDKIRVPNKKTGNKVVLPLHHHTKKILDKYNYSLPTRISNQNFNDYIKEACRIAGLDEHFTKTITKGGIKNTQTYEKWEVTSSHTARRSFATNLYKKGISYITIMALTGHKTEKAFLAYIKVTPEEHAEMLQKVFDDEQKRMADATLVI